MSDVPLGLLFAALILLILLSAFFSGSETALVTLNRYRLRHKAETGHPGARRAIQLLERPDRLIGLILLGNNFANILASSLATVIALRIGGEAAIAAAAGILTLVILIFAEVAPKTLAALHPERLAYPAARVYVPLLKLLYPLVWVVNGIANAMLRRFGIAPGDAHGQALSQEELKTVVMEAGAMIPERSQQMLLSILELEKATVEDIMIPRNEVGGLDISNALDEVIAQLQNFHYTRLPVYEGSIDQIVGVLHSRKVLHALMQGDLTIDRIRALMEDPYFIPEGTSLNRQLLNFQRKKRRIGLVVDEYGDFCGLITLADLLEEIVGEFTTDPAGNTPDIHPQTDGSFLVEGSASVRDLIRVMHWQLPTDGPKTLNGLILEQLETIPEPGASLQMGTCLVEILEIQDNAAKRVRVRPLPEG